MTSIILGKTPRLCDLVLKDGPNLGIYMIKEIAHTTRVLFEADQIVEIMMSTADPSTTICRSEPHKM